MISDQILCLRASTVKTISIRRTGKRYNSALKILNEGAVTNEKHKASERTEIFHDLKTPRQSQGQIQGQT